MNNCHLIYYLLQDIFPEKDSSHCTVLDGSEQSFSEKKNENRGHDSELFTFLVPLESDFSEH